MRSLKNDNTKYKQVYDHYLAEQQDNFDKEEFKFIE